MDKKYRQYTETMEKLADVRAATAVLQWDKEVYLPPKGARFRSQQVATLSGMAHDIFTEQAFGDLLKELDENKDQLTKHQARNVELSLKDYRQAVKYPRDFVVLGSRLSSAAYHAWIQAREKNDFNLFKGALNELIDYKRDEAELLTYEDHPYDALIDLFEPEATTAQLDPIFEDVRNKLHYLVQAIKGAKQVDNSFLMNHYPKDKQWDFGVRVLEDMGYDFKAGRQDISPHPFTITFSPEDVRVTTRIDEGDFNHMTWSCIHEGGHALYEQGLPADQYGLPMGTAVSLGIHESQSRLWENNVGRSLFYWEKRYDWLQKLFPESLKDVSLDQFYRGINRIEPGFIRTEADELHYHFHVMIRYELEKALMEDNLSADGVRGAWNDMYEEYLGVKVPDDKNGILQDIHWSHGSFGYFPTYSLGSFYAAQFFNQAKKEIPELEEQIRDMNSALLLEWLRKKVHAFGRFYNAEDLCRKITGEPLKLDYFLEYARDKYGRIYSLDLK